MIEYTKKVQFCTVCGGEIVVMCFKNTGVCCEDCRQVRDGGQAVPANGKS